MQSLCLNSRSPTISPLRAKSEGLQCPALEHTGHSSPWHPLLSILTKPWPHCPSLLSLANEAGQVLPNHMSIAHRCGVVLVFFFSLLLILSL